MSHAYDFALAAEREPTDYAELLEESGMKGQARAPMTPIVKLVFGIDYDGDVPVIFCRSPHHARSADVDILDDLVERSFVPGTIGFTRSHPALTVLQMPLDDQVTIPELMVRRECARIQPVQYAPEVVGSVVCWSTRQSELVVGL